MQSAVIDRNFDGIHVAHGNTNGGAFNLGGAQGAGDGHGGVQSAVFDSNFDGIDLSHINTNGGAFNLGGAQGSALTVMAACSGIEATNFDGISLDGIDPMAALSLRRRQGAAGGEAHGGVVSGIEASEFNNIHLSDVNTNGGGSNFGEDAGPRRSRRCAVYIDNSNFTNISFDHLNLNHGDFNFGGAQAAHFEVPHH